MTTAAGMAVAIPASVSLTWFESIIARLRLEMEGAATKIFLRPLHQNTNAAPLARGDQAEIVAAE